LEKGRRVTEFRSKRNTRDELCVVLKLGDQHGYLRPAFIDSALRYSTPEKGGPVVVREAADVCGQR
jgi:hypothetical protein